ncbi:26S proteasome regulatory subunit 8 homolog B [Tanacetum coccineum]
MVLQVNEASSLPTAFDFGGVVSQLMHGLWCDFLFMPNIVGEGNFVASAALHWAAKHHLKCDVIRDLSLKWTSSNSPALDKAIGTIELCWNQDADLRNFENLLISTNKFCTSIYWDRSLHTSGLPEYPTNRLHIRLSMMVVLLQSSTIKINQPDGGGVRLKVLSKVEECIIRLADTPHPSYLWMKSTVLDQLQWCLELDPVMVKFNGPCWSFLINWMDLRHQTRSKYVFEIQSGSVLMATNRIHILDQALLRLARIDRKIEFPNPNKDVCISILGSCLPILQ